MRQFVLVIILSFCTLTALAQQSKVAPMSLHEAIITAQERSIDGLVAKYSYLAEYWQYRSFKAQLLPSLSLDAQIPSFNRSLSAVQNSVTGEYNYVDNFYKKMSDWSCKCRSHVS